MDGGSARGRSHAKAPAGAALDLNPGWREETPPTESDTESGGAGAASQNRLAQPGAYFSAPPDAYGWPPPAPHRKRDRAAFAGTPGGGYAYPPGSVAHIAQGGHFAHQNGAAASAQGPGVRLKKARR